MPIHPQRNIDPAELESAVKSAFSGLKDEIKDDIGKVGRTPWDALTEIVSSIFELLGKWTTPLLFVAAIGGAFYFLQDQNQKQEADLNAQLTKLRAERDQAFDRISEFNKEVAEVSGLQITNLSKAFESLRTINEEANKGRTLVEQYKDETDAAKADLDAAKVDLETARKRIETEQAQLEETQEELAERKREIDRQERNLETRGGTIGDLQDLVKQLMGASEAYTSIQEELLDLIPETDLPDEVATRIFSDLAPAKSSYQDVLARVQASFVDPNEILTSVLNTSDLTALEKLIEPLIGMSATRFREMIIANNGFGFDFWREYETDSGRILLGMARIANGRIRGVSATLSPDKDRLIDVQSAELVSPIIAPSTRNVYENSAYYLTYSRFGEDFSVEDIQFFGDPSALTIPVVDIAEDIAAGDFIYGDNDAFQVLTDDEINALLNDVATPPQLRQALRDPEEFGLALAVKAEFDAGAPNLAKVVQSVTVDTKIRTILTDVFTIALGPILPNIAPPSQFYILDDEDLRSMASLALFPDLEMQFIENPRLIVQPPIIEGQEIPPKTWTQTGSIITTSEIGFDTVTIDIRRGSAATGWVLDKIR